MCSPRPPSKVHDLARAASLLLDAVDEAPPRTIETVETAFGRADVVLDDQGADVVLHDRDVTVHLRRDGGVDPDGRGG
jgi:hypothetical protein